MTNQELQLEALSRAANGQTLTYYPAIYQGFQEKGIPEAEIKPRLNVFTFQAWKALGRHVRKGEHGVKIATILSKSRRVRDEKTGEEKQESYSIPWTTTVFHISQTEKNDLR